MGDPVDAFGVDDLSSVLAVGALVLIVAVAAVRLSTRTGMPSLLIYLFIGVVVGQFGLRIPTEAMSLTRVLGYLALIVILGEGGLTTNWQDIRRSVAPAAVLSTFGVLVSVVIVAVSAHAILDIDWTVSLLLGAILASTDAAAVFSVLRRVPLPPRLTGILEAESGFNDAPAVLLVVALSGQAASQGQDQASPWLIALLIVIELLGGGLVGVGVGAAGAFFMRRMGSAAAGLFPIGVMAWVLLSYGAASWLHTSGFLAAYLAGVVLGNSRLPHRAAYRGFAHALGWFAQIGLFVMLGLLAWPAHLPPQLLPAVLLGLVLLLVARPASVWLSTVWFGLTWRDQAFLSWAGLRGAVPIVLATVPVISGVPGLDWMFDLVFVLVVVFTLLQAPTLPWVAQVLRVTSERAVDLDVESTPLEELGVDLLEVTIGPNSRLHGIELFELRLPQGADVSLIVRDRAAFVPDNRTVLRRGDRLLVVATNAARARAERQLHLVDNRGRLAGWGPAQGKSMPRVRRPAPPTRHGEGSSHRPWSEHP